MSNGVRSYGVHVAPRDLNPHPLNEALTPVAGQCRWCGAAFLLTGIQYEKSWQWARAYQHYDAAQTDRWLDIHSCPACIDG